MIINFELAKQKNDLRAIGLGDNDLGRLDKDFSNRLSSFTVNEVPAVETVAPVETVIEPVVEQAPVVTEEPKAETNYFDQMAAANLNNVGSVTLEAAPTINNEPVMQSAPIEETTPIEEAVVAPEVSAIPETPSVPEVDPVEAAIESTVNAVPVIPGMPEAKEAPVNSNDTPVFTPQTAQEFHLAEEKETVDVATRVFSDLKELVDENRNLKQENKELNQKVVMLEQRLNSINQVQAPSLDPTLIYNQAA